MAVNIHITIIELNALHTKRQNLFQELDAVIHLLMEAKHWGLRKSRNATSLNSRFKSLDTLKVKIISVTFRRVIRTNHKKASKIWRHENIQLGGCQSGRLFPRRMRANTISFTVFPEIVPSIGNSFINTMKNFNHTRSSISLGISTRLRSSGVVGRPRRRDRAPGPVPDRLAFIFALIGGHFRRNVALVPALFLEIEHHSHVGQLQHIDEVAASLALGQHLGVKGAGLPAALIGLDRRA